MWEIIPKISTGVSLAAFFVAAVLVAYAVRWRSRIRELREVPESERAKIVAAQAEFFNIDLSKIPQKDRAQIVIEQIRNKARKERNAAGILALMAILSFSAAVIDITASPPSPQEDEALSDPKALPGPSQITHTKKSDHIPEELPDAESTSSITYSAAEYSDAIAESMGWSKSAINSVDKKFPHSTDKFPDDVAKIFNLEVFESFPENYSASIKRDASLGYMNVRSWPGPTGRVLFKAPAGYKVKAILRCIAPIDVSHNRWCEILTSMGSGWISEVGIDWP